MSTNTPHAGTVSRWLEEHRDETWTPTEVQAATGAPMDSVWYALRQWQKHDWANPVDEHNQLGKWSTELCGGP